MRRIRRLEPLIVGSVILAAGMPASRLFAQREVSRADLRTAVRVHVADSSAAPVVGANVALVKGDSTLVLLARTDPAGNYRFEFSHDTTPYRIVVRRIGYTPAERAIHPGRGDTLSLSFVVARIGPTLDTVRIVERALPMDRRPYLDSTEIAASSRSILSLGDALVKLRGNLDYASSKCLPSPHIGVLSRGPLPRNHLAASLGRVPRGAEVYVNGELFPWEFDPWYSIASDAIADIQFVNCFDTTMPGLKQRPWPSVFVTLKPGYDWDNRGTFRLTVPDTGKVD
jgi:hypothetical protein